MINGEPRRTYDEIKNLGELCLRKILSAYRLRILVVKLKTTQDNFILTTFDKKRLKR